MDAYTIATQDLVINLDVALKQGWKFVEYGIVCKIDKTLSVGILFSNLVGEMKVKLTYPIIIPKLGPKLPKEIACWTTVVLGIKLHKQIVVEVECICYHYC